MMNNKTKKKKVKRVVKVREVPGMPCDVPGCPRPMNMGWKVLGHSKKICFYHFRRHINKNDTFDLFDVFKIQHLRIGIGVDRFGIPLPRDHKEMEERAKRNDALERKRRRDKSLSRLKEWKANGGVSTKPKPRPTPRPVLKEEIDSAIDDILGG